MTIAFTRRGALAGMRAALPLLLSDLVCAGTAQFIALGVWHAPLPVASLIATTLVVNLRHVLMGPALRRWLGRLPAPLAYGSAFFLTDESWALSLRELQAGRTDAAFLPGTGVALAVFWTGSTVLGHVAGALLPDPAHWGLDFVFAASLIALLTGLWKGRATLRPWLVAAVVAVIAAQLVPGQWYIVLGGLAGGIVGAWENAD
jgi:predicted branched-subunit amino acid permease